MTRFSFGSTAPRGWLTLAVPLLLAFAAPVAYGQGRSFHPRPITTASTMRSITPSMTAAPFTQTNAILRRDLRLDSPFRRDLRFDRFLEREFGIGPFAGTPFGTTPFGGTSGGGFSGSGISVIPVGVPSGNANPNTQKPSGDTADTARSALLLEQAVAERLANRRRAFDELQYERDKTATPEQELLRRSRGNPSPAEVRSGQALNALLVDLRRAGVDELNRSDALLQLDRRGLRHINVTRGLGNIALLKVEGRLTWPAALAGAAFQGPRERLTAQAPEAVRQAGNPGRVDSGILRQMTDDVSQLRQILRRNAKVLSFPPFTEARDFLQRFDDAVVALSQPDAADYFNGKYDLKALTVLGLVTQMTDAGLLFAPAVPGDEAAYAALWEALAASDRAAAKSQSAMR
jgi:hypothetical protein